MAQTGFTPIQIYRSSTASAAPTSGNLVAGELAINTADGKLFYLDNLNAVQVIGWKLVPTTAGGTGLSTYTTGDTLYSSATNTLAKLPIGSTGQVLTVASGLPAWAAIPSSMVYPSAGIPNSTGSAWGTSYGTTGTGSVVLSDSPTFTTAITSTGALQLTGSDTVNQNIATAQTTGTLAIGGTGATGAITLGQSTGAQNINISNGAASTSIVNIGGTGASTGNINIGRSTGTQTISIGSGGTGSTVTGTATRTINIGTSSLSTGISNVTIGKQSSTVNHTTTINGRYVTLNASTTLSLSAPSLALPQNTYISPITVSDLAFLGGVVQSSRSFVTDALAPTFGATVVGGGAVPVPVYYDGTNWKVG